MPPVSAFRQSCTSHSTHPSSIKKNFFHVKGKSRYHNIEKTSLRGRERDGARTLLSLTEAIEDERAKVESTVIRIGVNTITSTMLEITVDY